MPLTLRHIPLLPPRPPAKSSRKRNSDITNQSSRVNIDSHTNKPTSTNNN